MRELTDCNNNSFGSLTEREKEILLLIAEGFKSSQIAQKLTISVRTVEVHRRNVIGKLKLTSGTQLILCAQMYKTIYQSKA